MFVRVLSPGALPHHHPVPQTGVTGQSEPFRVFKKPYIAYGVRYLNLPSLV